MCNEIKFDLKKQNEIKHKNMIAYLWVLCALLSAPFTSFTENCPIQENMQYPVNVYPSDCTARDLY